MVAAVAAVATVEEQEWMQQTWSWGEEYDIAGKGDTGRGERDLKIVILGT